ncbi:MAG TPA: hypothetical protein VF628_02235 [Allosphingosinicella sp.]
MSRSRRVCPWLAFDRPLHPFLLLAGYALAREARHPRGPVLK